MHLTCYKQRSEAWRKMELRSGRSMTVTIVLVLCCIQVAGAFTYDGRPRPKGYPDVPTTAYGKLPTLYNDAGFAVDCDWYGWANVNYPATIGNPCLDYTWRTEILEEVGQNTLDPYDYYDCTWGANDLCYDNVTSKAYCTIGCFYLNGTTGLPPISYTPPALPGALPSRNSDVGKFQQTTALVWCAVVGAAALILNQLDAR